MYIYIYVHTHTHTHTHTHVDNGLEIVLDTLRHSKPGEPRRKQAVSICHGACVLKGEPGVRVFITNVKGTFLGMSESEEASKRR